MSGMQKSNTSPAFDKELFDLAFDWEMNNDLRGQIISYPDGTQDPLKNMSSEEYVQHTKDIGVMFGHNLFWDKNVYGEYVPDMNDRAMFYSTDYFNRMPY